MKSEVFCGQRFWTYFKYDLARMWRNHVKAAILIGFSGLILYVLGVAFSAVVDQTWSAPNFASRVMVFFLSVFALELYQTRTYGYLTNRRKGASWLMVPASTFEKWLSMILLTLVVIPLSFLGTYTLIDGILSLADPTYGPMMLGSAQGALQKMSLALNDANMQYSTSWNLTPFILLMVVGYMANFLYFLLCGITFRRNKIVWAFIILFISSIVLSMGMTAIGLQTKYDFEELADAEVFLRGVLQWSMVCAIVLVICFAGGIFYRIKTLKH